MTERQNYLPTTANYAKTSSTTSCSPPGLEAYERISGVPAENALAQLATTATPDQRERVLKRCERGEES